MKFFLYNEQVDAHIQEIKKLLYVHMNGEVSSKMEEKGYKYKVNYGTLLSELKEIAKRYTPEMELAERLWSMPIRETKILATYLYPLEEFTEEKADEWVYATVEIEIAEILVLNLLSKLSFTNKKIKEWLFLDFLHVKTMAYLLLARTYRNIESEELITYVDIALETLKKETDKNILESATLALKRIASKEEKLARLLQNKIIQRNKSQINQVFFEEILSDLNFYLNQ